MSPRPLGRIAALLTVLAAGSASAQAADPPAEEPTAQAPVVGETSEPELEAPSPTASTRPDADGDRFFDAIDECPNNPEVNNAFEDDDGCPDTKTPRDAIWPTTSELRPEPPPLIERCHDTSKIAGGITLLVLSASGFALGVMGVAYGSIDLEGGNADSGLNDLQVAGIGALGFGAAMLGAGLALVIIGKDRRPCSELAGHHPVVPSLEPTPTGAAIRWSY